MFSGLVLSAGRGDQGRLSEKGLTILNGSRRNGKGKRKQIDFDQHAAFCSIQLGEQLYSKYTVCHRLCTQVPTNEDS
jgi:hypothetical protein